MCVKSVLRFLPVAAVVLMLASCATAAEKSINAVSGFISTENFIQAKAVLEAQKEFLYTDNDKVLYNLDGGLISHYAGDWKESNKSLSEAESLIEYYYSKSVSQGVGSYLVNDMVLDYPGDDYEDIYSNFFMSLNYVQLGLFDDALVEVRRFDNKLKVLSTKYEPDPIFTESSSYAAGSQFSNSAAARYLSMLLYRTDGRMDSAELDLRLLRKAFSEQPQLYDFQVPSFLDEEFAVPKGKARLNIMAFAGLAPIKQEISREYKLPNGIKYTLAIPEMVLRGSKVASISVEVYDADGNNAGPVEEEPRKPVDDAGAASEATAQEEQSSRSAAARARAAAMGLNARGTMLTKADNRTRELQEERNAALKAKEQNLAAYEGRVPLYRTVLEKLESIENIALGTFNQNQSTVVSRAILRSAGKAVKNSVLDFMADNAKDPSVSTALSIVSFLSQTIDEETEKADLRTSRYFPAEIHAGGITLDPGVYSVVVTFRDARGNVLSTTVKENVIASAKSINIVEAVCSK